MWYRIRGSRGVKQALQGARRERGLTQAQLAGLVGTDRTTILNMEAGRNPAVNRLVEAFATMGFDLIAVPRTAHVSVAEGAPDSHE
ncbi:hypothetical protein Cs7R123_78410 [Catellatospora sp. TT07R-123]|uniref:helix-turn-helix domain-containing protein n=1 Tax=Catellatospora sp. TT07R-123 TaxID=2733863 RepID=UPI001B0258F0|nr:helix-turn-helix domain-containing protein [Catellatospora sp. TT07R-123]GHJ50499.1 hypothetical protein Cs7R123_78410 [Catellatospora sp. TT07R-123]